MNDKEKAKEIAENSKQYFYLDEYECGLACALRMAKWKDEQVKQIQEREIKACNDYIEKHPNNKLMLKYHLGRLSLCDELLGTDSKDKINMAFATMD